jgi:hypothetical protein
MITHPSAAPQSIVLLSIYNRRGVEFAILHI